MVEDLAGVAAFPASSADEVLLEDRIEQKAEVSLAQRRVVFDERMEVHDEGGVNIFRGALPFVLPRQSEFPVVALVEIEMETTLKAFRLIGLPIRFRRVELQKE